MWKWFLKFKTRFLPHYGIHLKDFANAEVGEIASFYRKIAANIRRIRKAKRVSQLDVAQTIGMTSVTFYTNAENGK